MKVPSIRTPRTEYIARVLPIVGLLVIAVGSVASIALARLDRELRGVRTALRSMEKAQQSGERQLEARSSTLAEPSDFVRSLPPIALQAILSTVERSASDAGVVFAGAQIQDRPASKELLARTDLSVSLRGPYPKLTQVLSDVLSRYPSATLARASLRRQGPPDQVDAAMVVALWGAPLMTEQQATKPASINGAASSTATEAGQ